LIFINNMLSKTDLIFYFKKLSSYHNYFYKETLIIEHLIAVLILPSLPYLFNGRNLEKNYITKLFIFLNVEINIGIRVSVFLCLIFK